MRLRFDLSFLNNTVRFLISLQALQVYSSRYKTITKGNLKGGINTLLKTSSK